MAGLMPDLASYFNFDLSKKSYHLPVFGLEILTEINDNYSPVLKDYWGDVIYNPLNWFIAAQKKAKDVGATFISVYFNSQEPQEEKKPELLKEYAELIKQIQKAAVLPLMIKFTSHTSWDIALAQAIIPHLNKTAIISPVQAADYKEIIAASKSGPLKHYFVLRTPIDINLTKELNILSLDEGLTAEQILIDPDMGCIGYGIDYGYSIIERICLTREAGDKMLDMPIIVFAGEESYKAKESKSADFASSWGNLEQRAICWEVSTASALICAGANIAVMWHPEAIKVLNKEFCEVNKCH